jgi:hypothetical protein
MRVFISEVGYSISDLGFSCAINNTISSGLKLFPIVCSILKRMVSNSENQTKME